MTGGEALGRCVGIGPNTITLHVPTPAAGHHSDTRPSIHVRGFQLHGISFPLTRSTTDPMLSIETPRGATFSNRYVLPFLTVGKKTLPFHSPCQGLPIGSGIQWFHGNLVGQGESEFHPAGQPLNPAELVSHPSLMKFMSPSRLENHWGQPCSPKAAAIPDPLPTKSLAKDDWGVE